MKNKLLSFMIILSLAAAAFSACGQSSANSGNNTEAAGSQESDVFPDNASSGAAAISESASSGSAVLPDSVSSEYVALPEDVKAEMLSSEYWKAKASSGRDALDDILMSAEEIRDFNHNNSCLIISLSGRSTTLEELGDEADGSFVSELIESQKIPKKPEKYCVAENGSAGGPPTDREYWEELYALENTEAVPDAAEVRFGFSVAWTTLRKFPTRDRVVKDGDLMFDEMVISDLKPYEPLAVVHESSDKNWYYCLTAGSAGWIEKEYTALCADRDEWAERQDMQDFLVVTGDVLTLSDDPYDEAVSGLSLPMGTRLELVKAENAPESLNGRIGYGCYVVKIPVRDGNGYIEDRYAYIPSGKDVHKGYLDLTREAVITQAFKYLGDVYGWGGDLHSVDCSGMVRGVYSCFGFCFPKTASAQEMMKGPESADLAGKTDEEKAEILKTVPAGSLVFFNGHVMIWLGEDNGDLYVISSASLFGSSAVGADDVNTVSVNSLRSSYRADGTSWIENISSILMF